MSGTSTPIAAGTKIGHVHLKVADLERAMGFYCGVLGFQLMQRYGDQAAFISAGGYHHHIGLNTWESKGGTPPAPGTTGLFHTAILYPTRAALADAGARGDGGGLIGHGFFHPSGVIFIPALCSSPLPLWERVAARSADG